MNKEVLLTALGVIGTLGGTLLGWKRSGQHQHCNGSTDYRTAEIAVFHRPDRYHRP